MPVLPLFRLHLEQAVHELVDDVYLSHDKLLQEDLVVRVDKTQAHRIVGAGC